MQNYGHPRLQLNPHAPQPRTRPGDVKRVRQVSNFVNRNLHRQHHFFSERSSFFQHRKAIILFLAIAEQLPESPADTEIFHNQSQTLGCGDDGISLVRAPGIGSAQEDSISTDLF